MAANSVTFAGIISTIHAAADFTQTCFSHTFDDQEWTEFLHEVSTLMNAMFHIEKTILDVDIAELLPSQTDSMDQEFLQNAHTYFSRIRSKLQKLHSENLSFQNFEWQGDIEILHKLQVITDPEGLLDPPEWSGLFGACFIGDLDRIRILLSNNADYRIQTKFGWTVLHWAIIGNHSEIVQEIFDHHSQSQNLVIPFHRMKIAQVKSYSEAVLPVVLAARMQNIDIFNLVVKYLEIPETETRTAMFNRIWKSGRFDVRVSFRDMNPWRAMSKNERVNGFECLVPKTRRQFTSNPKEVQDDPQKWKSTLLHHAIQDEQFIVAQMLVRAGADVNYCHALHMASFRKDSRYVTILLEGGADPNVVNLFGRTALNEAFLNGFADTATALIEGGADVNHGLCPRHNKCMNSFMDSDFQTKGYRVRPSHNGATSLMLACGFKFILRKQFVQKIAGINGQLPQETAIELVRLLLAEGADPTLTDSSGMTVLHYVALKPDLELIELLIKSGSLIDSVDREGRTPLQYLARCDEQVHKTEDLEKITRLLSFGNCSVPQQDILNYPVTRPVGLTEVSKSSDIESKKQPPVLVRVIRRKNVISHEEEHDELRTPIMSALLANRWRIARILSDLGARAPSRHDLEATIILDQAIEAIEPEIVDMLLGQGLMPSTGSVLALVKSFNSRDMDQNAADAVNLYVKFKHILMVLVRAGIDVNFFETPDTEMNGTTALLHAATHKRSRRVLQDLLDLGADPFATCTKHFDSIRATAVFGEPEDLSFIWDHAIRHANGSQWFTCLGQKPGMEEPLSPMCLYLQEAGILNSTNSQGRTLLHLAAEQGNARLIEALVSHNARTDIADSQGWLALHCAGFAQQTNALDILLSSGSSTVSVIDSTETPDLPKILSSLLDKDGHNFIDIAFLHRNLPMVSILLKHGVDPNYIVNRRHQGNVPALYLAAERGNYELASLLLQHKVDLEASDSYGWHPLHIACFRGHIDIVRALITAGADVHSCTKGWNDSNAKPSGLYQGNRWTSQPLHLATMGGHADIVEILLGHGVDIHADTGASQNMVYFVPSHGPTALHLALDTGTFYCRQGKELSDERLRIAQMLVEAGARVKGVISQFQLEKVFRFLEFPLLWNALVAGELVKDAEENSQ
ncbi:ankyrin repeat-containing protein [Penicillium macrosclerotiorum]|uniref:ankyrin repeat-containing protein n=1 Tax=Penicillium macrosclerotiorum TaxID=303699 RepID=UPI002548E68C|nr:ankyrin repeat-containing protein [Penicillium macrosclerotiorum]KAJ5690434.1 ankyrin repeat-containing protein [Penicillium macrosclerotiorum]